MWEDLGQPNQGNVVPARAPRDLPFIHNETSTPTLAPFFPLFLETRWNKHLLRVFGEGKKKKTKRKELESRCSRRRDPVGRQFGESRLVEEKIRQTTAMKKYKDEKLVVNLSLNISLESAHLEAPSCWALIIRGKST
jgi:hypothetical protein